MIVKIPDDIFNYVHKVLGNFTKRQLVFAVIALVAIAAIFIGLFWNTNDPNISTVVAFMVGVVIFFVGLDEKEGQHFETILWIRFLEKFWYKRKRKFVMSNLYEVLQANQKEYETYVTFKKQEQAQQEGKQGHLSGFLSLAKKRHRPK